MTRKSDKPSSAEVKSNLADWHAKSFRDAGKVPPTREIETEAARMLERYEARQRESKPRSKPVRKPADPAQHEAKKLGASFHRGDGTVADVARRTRARYRWANASMTANDLRLRARIRKLIQTTPGTNLANPDFVYPQYARPFLDEFVAFKAGSGEYFGLIESDRHRKFAAFAEGLADRSAGLPELGPWR